MKKISLLLSVIGLLTVSMMLPSSLSAMRVQGDDPTLIVILPPATSPEGAPRSPAFNPFTAYLNGNAVVLNCSASYGNVAVTLVSTAGDNYTTVFDTEDGSVIIPVSGLSGHYTLLITTASGSQFIGEFEM